MASKFVDNLSMACNDRVRGINPKQLSPKP